MIKPIHLIVAALGALPLLARAQEGAIPVTPGEINAGLKLQTRDFLVAPHASWLAFSTDRGCGTVDLATGKLANANSDWALVGSGSSGPLASWAPDRSQLALEINREGVSRLAIWSPTSAAPREIFKFARRNFPQMPPIWSKDGKTLYFVVTQDLPWPKSSPDDDHPPTANNNVELSLSGVYFNPSTRLRFAGEYPGAYAERMRSLILAIDVASGRMGVLGRGNDVAALSLSPDGKFIAAVQLKTHPPAWGENWSEQNRADIYLIPTAAPESLPTVDLQKFEDRRAGWHDLTGDIIRPVLTDVLITVSEREIPVLVWSPDSARFAYATVGRRATGDVFIYDLAAKQERNATAGLALESSGKTLGYGENYTFKYNSQRFGGLFPPLWLPDGQALVAVARGEVWLIPADSAQVPHLLTANLPVEVRHIVPSLDPNRAAIDGTGRIIVVTKDRLTRWDSIWKINPHTNEPQHLVDTGVWMNRKVLLDESGDHLYYSGQTDRSVPNLFQVALTANAVPKAITRFQAELPSRDFPESEALRWATPTGAACGLLYLPKAVAAQGPAPLVVIATPAEESSWVDVRAQDGAAFYSEEIHGLLQQGLAVLLADIPMSDAGVYAHPFTQVTEGATAALDAALATGRIDRTRVGILGTGYGGFMVQAVITQTTRFKAAVSVGGSSDWFGGYAGGNLSMAFYETGQGRFAKPLWDDPQRYLENSPISYWDKVETPILLIGGRSAFFYPMRNVDESFRGLERLGRNAILAEYRRMGDGANDEANLRILGWFKEHLLGGKPMTHAADQGSFFFGGAQPGDQPAVPAGPLTTPH